MEYSPFRPLPWEKHGDKYLLVAGSCSAESREQTLALAHRLRAMGLRYYRASLWKPRTQPGGFEGVGSVGLSWLREVEQETGMYAMTEVATPAHVEACLNAGLKHLWIGARTTSSPFAVSELAESLRGCDLSVLVKNPINPDLKLWEGALLRLHSAGVKYIGAIHRGFSTYGEQFYRNSPIWQIPIELKLRHPELSIIVDPSHIGGKRSLIEGLCRSALEMNFDGLMIETHTAPHLALSDASQQITPEELGGILQIINNPLGDDAEGLHHWREEINELDKQLLNILAQRQQVVEHIGRYKQRYKMSILHPQRYRELMQEREQEALSLGLRQSYVHDLFSRIHEESVRHQQELL